jgi:hypothetical protein
VSFALAHRHSALNEFSSPAQRRLVLAGRREITPRVLEIDVQHFVADTKRALDEIFKLLVRGKLDSGACFAPQSHGDLVKRGSHGVA